MAIRVGIDLVSVETVQDSIREHGDSYLQRIYTERELNDCREATGTMAERLAGRFAAKEAALKVLRPEREAVPWATIEVVRQPLGWVELELSGHAAALAERQGLGTFALSIAHEQGYATAVVVADCA